MDIFSSRYIHLNPVRAKVVERPEAYLWSSYPGYQRASRALDWVCYERVLGALAKDRTQARRAYGRFVSSQADQGMRSPFASAVGGLLLGSEGFVERMRRLLAGQPEDKAVPQLTRLRHRPSLATIVSMVAQDFGVDPSAWQPGTRHDDAGRAVAAWLARREFGYSVKDISKSLGYRSHGSVRSAVLRVDNGNQRLARQIPRLKAMLTND
jgi:hypothetical protein